MMALSLLKVKYLTSHDLEWITKKTKYLQIYKLEFWFHSCRRGNLISNWLRTFKHHIVSGKVDTHKL